MRRWSAFFLLALALFFSSCATKDSDHRILVSVADQSLALYHKETLLGRYPVSTSQVRVGRSTRQSRNAARKNGSGEKIGAGAPLGAVFKSRRRTGEVLSAECSGSRPDRDSNHLAERS